MDSKQPMADQVSAEAAEWAKNFEQKGMALAESVKSLVTTLETIAQSVSQFFSTLKRQKDSVLDFTHRAGEQIRPVADASFTMLGKGRDVSTKLVRKSRDNPLPFVLGGIAVVGGIALLAYYLNQESDESNQGAEAAPHLH